MLIDAEKKDPAQHASMPKLPRPYKFLELFAGMGGMSLAIKDVCGDLVEVLEPQDLYHQWDILTDEGFAKAEEWVEEADHTHIAFPCRSFTRSRRTDEHAVVLVVRTDTHPEGWGHPIAEEGNQILNRVAKLVFKALERRKTVSLENPLDAFSWEVKIMKQMGSAMQEKPYPLDQCPYGAETKKPTNILTGAEWMKEVNLRCHQVRRHRHREGGLTGFVWDPITEDWVWRTSRAAEYPQGLCRAWADALRTWLLEEKGKAWLAARTMVKVGRFQNVLINASALQPDAVPKDNTVKVGTKDESNAERRERENMEAVGGLRDPRRAVARNKQLQRVGQRIRQCLDRYLSGGVIKAFEETKDACPFSDELVLAARRSLATEFCAELEVDGYQSWLLGSMLTQANDPDAATLPGWLRDGFPIGISEEITYTGIFPQTDDVSAAVKASQAFATMTDWDGTAENYVSFVEAGDKAQAELDRLVACGRAERVDDWQSVVDKVGEARLTKMACIVKQKGGKEKVRIIVDMRRSGINGWMKFFERVVLPRISDCAMSLHELLKESRQGDTPEFFIIDFRDAFYTLKLSPKEKRHTVVKGNCGSYFILHCVCFGLSCGPLVWGRLAAALLRLGQSCLLSREGRTQCYVDDPIFIALGRNQHERSMVFARITLLWCALGASLAWQKVARGHQVEWIGVQLQLQGDAFRSLRVCLTKEKTSKLFEIFSEIMSFQQKGMIPTAILAQAAGIMGWVSNLIPCCRPWTGALWAAVVAAKSHEGGVKPSTRNRKGLTFWKQVEFAVKGLKAMLCAASLTSLSDASAAEVSGSGQARDFRETVFDVSNFHGCQLAKLYRFEQDLPLAELFTDACPFGLGAVLCIGTKPVAFWKHALVAADAHWMGPHCGIGDPSYQTEWEAWAVLLAVRVFGPLLNNGSTRIFLRSDNVATLQAATKFKARSPLLNRIAAELVIELEVQGQSTVQGRHIRGVLNSFADSLSRGSVPAALKGIQEVHLSESSRLIDRCHFHSN